MSRVKRMVAFSLLLTAGALALGVMLPARAQESTLTPIEQLGKMLFFDKNLSAKGNQACAACHGPQTGFTGPVSAVNATGSVYPGSHPALFGNRHAPTVAYAGFSPVLAYDEANQEWAGGMFWDGRATGWTLDDPLAEQAQGPFLNPVEQALTDAADLCALVSQSDYTTLFEAVWGEGTLDCAANADQVYEQVARSIAAYERSYEVSPFSSKYDYYLAGGAELTEQEALGLELFNDKAGCAECHPSEPGPNGEAPLFTDFTYDNLGVPRDPHNPYYRMPEEINPDGAAWVDPGLGGFLKANGETEAIYQAEWGKHKVPTLRNVALKPSEDFVRSYMHNGYFKTLEDVVHFYNTRDVEAWPEPEVAENVNTEEVGNLTLTAEEEAAIVAFLHTLSDGYVP